MNVWSMTISVVKMEEEKKKGEGENEEMTKLLTDMEQLTLTCKRYRRKLKTDQEKHAKEVSKLKQEILATDKHCTLLTDQIAQMTTVIQQRIPKEEYDSSIDKCKSLLDELKSNYAEDSARAAAALNEANMEKDRLASQLVTTNAEISKLQDKIKDLEKTNLDYAGSLVILRKELSISVAALEVNEAKATEMMRLAEVIRQEKEALERSYNDQRQAMTKIMSVRMQEVNLIKECQEKMKTMEAENEMKLEHHLTRVEKLQDVLETISERHEADIVHLQELVNEKNIHIEKLTTEKRQLAEDLETVWKTTTRNQNVGRRDSANGRHGGRKPSPGETYRMSPSRLDLGFGDTH